MEAVEPAGIELFSTNPELMIANRYAAEAAERIEANFLAANPEINVYRRYVANP